MTTSYDIARPFAAIEGEHGFWTVQARTPNGPCEWVLVECSGRDAAAANRRADFLNDIIAAQ